MRQITILLLVMHSVLLQTYNFVDITQYGHEQYQDIIINNVIVSKATHNHKDNEARYHIIKEVLDRFNRPFDMIDLGASQGYYSFRTAHDFKDSVCIMVEGNNPSYPMTGTQLQQLCELNSNLKNTILLKKPLSAPDLIRLSECEQFDVVLALNIIHWLGNDWRKAIDALVKMGTYIIIETPPQETHLTPLKNERRKQIENYILKKKAILLGSVKRHTSNVMSHIYLIHSKTPTIERTSWISPKNSIKDYEIISTFEKKTLIKHCELKQPKASTEYTWFPGINLMTFKMYNGSFPSSDSIIKAIEKTKHLRHKDWMPNNMILQGNNIKLIDDEPAYTGNKIINKRVYTKKFADALYRMVRMHDPKAISSYFWNKLRHIV